MELLYTSHIPASDGPFPTIVALHGWGASAHDLLGLAPILAGGTALILCPQGPISFQAGPGAVGYGWFPLTQGAPSDPVEVEKGVEAVQGFLDAALPEHPVDPRKVVLMGFSQGGVMAYALALRNPDRYAGLVALSSWLPEGLAESIPSDPALESLPTLVIHGTEDTMISVDKARQSRDRLSKLGVPITYREFRMAHEINSGALRALVDWLDEKVIHPVLIA